MHTCAHTHTHTWVLQVVMLYTVGIIAALATFQAVPAGLPWLQWANVFMIGFFLWVAVWLRANPTELLWPARTRTHTATHTQSHTHTHTHTHTLCVHWCAEARWPTHGGGLCRAV